MLKKLKKPKKSVFDTKAMAKFMGGPDEMLGGTKAVAYPNVNGKYDVEVTCEVCGERITHVDQYGMWCDKECNRKQAIRGAKAFDKFFNTMAALFGE